MIPIYRDSFSRNYFMIDNSLACTMSKGELFVPSHAEQSNIPVYYVDTATIRLCLMNAFVNEISLAVLTKLHTYLVKLEHHE